MGYLETIFNYKPIYFRVSFHVLCILVFTVFCFLNKPPNNKQHTTYRAALSSNYTSSLQTVVIIEPTDCSGLNQHTGFENQCEYLKANPQCKSGGLFYYLDFFYCQCSNHNLSFIGYIILAIWLAALFYLLGNTSADYFCCCLEKLSNVLRLPPTVAGVTLLPLGNGAPDVFASIAAFVGTDNNADVGLNSISGGSVFIICVVVGSISLYVADQNVSIDKKCFVRDVCTFLFAVVVLGVILFVGEVNVGGAIVFVSIYVVYATFVAASEIFRKKGEDFKIEKYEPLLPLSDINDDAAVPHLVESKVPHWMWGSNVAIYSEVTSHGLEDNPIKPQWGWIDEETQNDNSGCSFSCSKLLKWLEFPLMLPRRLTIPIIEEERWSKGYAVASVTFAPLLLAFLWNSRNEGGELGENVIYILSAVAGGGLGVAAFTYTKSDQPPQKLLLPWVLGGFFMSIIWFYMVANELVALLVSLGLIFSINPSILGLTVLAWGNSMGDLMSNVALAMNGADGVQIAISGCYAGPMFNTLVGLGVSMLIGSWSKRPDPYTISRDSGLFCNLGFIVIGLVWALVVLPRNQMQPNKLLGIGLIGIYLVFLCLRIGMAVVAGLLNDSS